MRCACDEFHSGGFDISTKDDAVLQHYMHVSHGNSLYDYGDRSACTRYGRLRLYDRRSERASDDKPSSRMGGRGQYVLGHQQKRGLLTCRVDACRCAAHSETPPNLIKGKTMVNLYVGVFAIFLCVVNAAVWTFITGLPFIGGVWLLAAAACVKLQKWSWSPWAVRF